MAGIKMMCDGPDLDEEFDDDYVEFPDGVSGKARHNAAITNKENPCDSGLGPDDTERP